MPGDDASSGQGLGSVDGGDDAEVELRIELFAGPQVQSDVSVEMADGISDQLHLCDSSPCTFSLEPGTPVSLVAAPAADFIEWEPQLGAGCSYMSEAGVSARLTITRDCTIYAYFGEPGLPPPPGE